MAGIYVYRSEDDCYVAMSMQSDEVFNATLGLAQSTPIHIMTSTIRTGLSNERLSKLEEQLIPVLDTVNNRLVVSRRIGDHKHVQKFPRLSPEQKEQCIDEVFRYFK